MSSINFDAYHSLKQNMGDLMPELKKVFIEDAHTLIREILEGLEKNDTNQILTAAHTLKSSAKSMGASKLADYCLDLENSINKESLSALYQTMSVEMDDVEKTLNSID